MAKKQEGRKRATKKATRSQKKAPPSRELQPLSLGDFVVNENLVDGYASDDSKDDAKELDSDTNSDQSTTRSFSCATTTAGGRAVALRVEIEQTFKTKKGYWLFQISAYTLEGEYVIDSTPLTFVLKRQRDERTVEDLRIYLKTKYRSRGVAHLLVSFVKAFFFPFYTMIPGRDRPIRNLPLGGSWVVERLSVLPTAAIAKRFYARQGFRAFDGENKWLFWPTELSVESCQSTALSFVSSGDPAVVGPEISAVGVVDSEPEDVPPALPPRDPAELTDRVKPRKHSD
jgi:hypothetical protein